MMKDVELGHAGLGGTNVDTVTSDDWAGSAEKKRILDHAKAEFKYAKLKGVFIINSDDQATDLREQGNKFRHEHELCRTPSIESDFCVALEMAGLPKGTFANVNSYGANVAVSRLLP
jgi:hypothetical protein